MTQDLPSALVGVVDELTDIVSRAAAAILAARAAGLKSRTKADASPVTAADEAAEAVILDGLSRALPGVPVVSEETPSEPPAGGTFVLVDPLDGTRELVAGRDEFCVNLAVVHDGRACIGIIAAPVYSLIWRTARGGGAERLRLAPGASASAAQEHGVIRPRAWPDHGAIAAVSRSHLDGATKAFLARLPPVQTAATGSAIKLCRIAEGAADVYPRLSPVCQWDVAAGDAIVSAAGGIVTTPHGDPLRYGRTAHGSIVPAFIAWGDRDAARKIGRDQGDSVF